MGYDPAMSEANKSLAREWFELVWNQKSEATIDRMFQPQRKVYGLPGADSVLVGPEGFKPFYRMCCGALPDIHVEIEDAISEGDRVAVRWKATGTHRGDHFGFPASGKRAVITGSSFFLFEGNQIVEAWNHMDLQDVFMKLQAP
jgi:steroid delta-isomerase-like uncharacterized protein